jgi:hypothetical protein
MFGRETNLVPRACDPREGTRGSGIIRFREESDWPLKWMRSSIWLPATDYPRASRSFPRIAGSGNEIAMRQVILTESLSVNWFLETVACLHRAEI